MNDPRPLSPARVVLRRAVLADVEAIVRLGHAGGPPGSSREPLLLPLPAAYFESFAAIDADPRSTLMVAELEGVVVGTWQVTYLAYLAAKGRTDALVEAVHVSEKHRDHGIGTQMMTWAIEEARRRGCRRVQLTTDKRRANAHRFYEKLGFVATHEGMKLTFAPM